MSSRIQMNGIINRGFKHKNLLRFRRKFTSAAVFPAKPATGNAGYHTQHRPLRILRSPANLEIPARTEAESAHVFLLKSDAIYSNVYSEVYEECGRRDHAFKVFDEMPVQNSAYCNLMILQGCNGNFQYDDSWRVFCHMHKLGLCKDAVGYSSVLSGCAGKEFRGGQIHGLVVRNGLYFDENVAFGVADLYAKSCRMEDSLRVLNDVHCDNVFCWNAVVSGAVKKEDYSIALWVFTEMCHHNSLSPDAFTFTRVLAACVGLGEIEYGRSIHGQVIRHGVDADIFVGNGIVDLYATLGDASDAIKQFKSIPVHSMVSWAAMIRCFVRTGDAASAVRVLNDMRRVGEDVNKFAFSKVLAACANPGMFKEVLQIHCWVLKTGLHSDAVVKAPLINTYSKSGAMDLSELAFEEARADKQVGIWANMISAYVHWKNHEKAIVFFRTMLEEGVVPNQFIATSVLGIVDDLKFGRQVHGYTTKLGMLSEVSVGSSIFTMYSKCGDLEESLKAFEQLEMKDVISWTSMIAGFAEHGSADEAIRLFREMRHKDSVFDDKILAAVINACSSLDLLKPGREIHGFALRCGFNKEIVTGALVNMYSKCGDLRSAMTVFSLMPYKNLVSWSAIISGFSQRGHVEEALDLLKEMLQSDMSIDTFTISSVLGAIATSGNPQIGTPLHAHTVKVGLESYPVIGSSLIMMYSKGGSINDCVEVFERIIDPDLVSWTAMIDSLAYHGKGREALSSFHLMKKSGIKPDALTFVGVLAACSHAGLVDEGYFHLNSMIREYSIQPDYKHYACVVDLLGRAGRLEEAVKLISNMPIVDTLVWETLLAACKVHGRREIGKLAAQKIMELQPSNASAYVMISNIWAEAGEWEHVQKMRGLMKESNVQKSEPGWSYV